MKNGCRGGYNFMIMPLSKIQRCILVYVCALCTQICVLAWLCKDVRNNEEEEERWMFLDNLIQICIIDLDQFSNLGIAQSKSTWQTHGNAASSISLKWKIHISFGSYLVNRDKSHVKVESHLCMLNWGPEDGHVEQSVRNGGETHWAAIPGCSNTGRLRLTDVRRLCMCTWWNMNQTLAKVWTLREEWGLCSHQKGF